MTSAQAPSPAPTAPAKAKKSRRGLFIILSLALLGGGVFAWRTIAGKGLETTDNAMVEAEIVPVPALAGGVLVELRFQDNQRVAAGDVLARIDDATAKAKLAQAEATLAAAEASAKAADADARVTTQNATGGLGVAEASKVAAESVASTTRVQLREADAAVRAAQAAYAQTVADRDRDLALAKDGVVSQATVEASTTKASVAASNLEAARAHLTTLRAGIDQAQTKVGEAAARVSQVQDVDAVRAQAQARADAARAQVEVARAARAVAQLDLDHTVIRAPRPGVLSKKMVSAGQMIAAGQAVAQLVTDDRWVTANFKETQIDDIDIGQTVTIEVDALPGLRLHGEVESFAGATGARFALMPPDNASGNFTKVVQRVPVRVRLIAGHADEAADEAGAGALLRPGLSVSVTVDTRTTPKSVAKKM